MRLPNLSFTRLNQLTDDKGIFEHAEGTLTRYDHGYCVDDVARALVVVSRVPMTLENPERQKLCDIYLSFLLSAQTSNGSFHNRLGLDRRWKDQSSVQDCWGRALWGLGTFISSQPEGQARETALRAFTIGAKQRSPWLRSMAFAALGATEVLQVLPNHYQAQSILKDTALRIGRPRTSMSWPWPEDRLEYANAVLPEILIAAGTAFTDESLVEDGLILLGWLVELETFGGHLSVTPVGGRGPTDISPAFDQQPIEVAALADACVRALKITGDRRWVDALELTVEWFLGNNDACIPLYDPVSGGCCDGLERFGRNENQGAESTLAALSTLQHGHSLSERAL
ncbi:MAG: glycosyltransferase [Acidimicrobiaceae bacterium]|nr:glycosyltransferase [Acidimicrobiaceae bacterium]